MRKTEDYNIIFSDKAPENNEKKNKTQVSQKFNIFDFFGALVAAVTVVAIIFTCFIRVVKVDGRSMVPTLEDGDRIISTSVGYTPKVGDVVVISATAGVGKSIVKRIIAVGGDVVDINFATGVVSVNGNEEDYTDELTNQQYDIAFPITVPEGCVFVLGDNRPKSLDSRSSAVGCIDSRCIIGKVLFRLYPLGKWTVD